MASYQVRQRDPLLDQTTQAMLERRGRELLGVALLVLVQQLPTGNAAGLELLAAGFLGLVLLQAVSSYFEQWSLQLLGQRSMHGLRLAIYKHVMSQRAAFFDRIPVGR
ncbi:MAG: ABC transporter ATP-binding protein [Nitrospiraceae bacterium]|nr:ABC transporter ATP-binding protein [Nitrospiraceae bacterium]